MYQNYNLTRGIKLECPYESIETAYNMARLNSSVNLTEVGVVSLKTGELIFEFRNGLLIWTSL